MNAKIFIVFFASLIATSLQAAGDPVLKIVQPAAKDESLHLSGRDGVTLGGGILSEFSERAGVHRFVLWWFYETPKKPYGAEGRLEVKMTEGRYLVSAQRAGEKVIFSARSEKTNEVVASITAKIEEWEYAAPMTIEPNQSPEPTPGAGTSRAKESKSK